MHIIELFFARAAVRVSVAVVALIIVLGVAALALARPAAADDWGDLIGQTIDARVVALDGDTLLVMAQRLGAPWPDVIQAGQTRIRLWGISAPEMSSTQGWQPLHALDTMLKISDGVVACHVLDIHRPRRGAPRPVARCAIHNSTDLSETLTAQGWAAAYRVFTYRDPAHLPWARALDRLQFEAAANARGFWRDHHD